MQRHDSQERMEAGSPRAAAPPAPLDSSPSSFSLRSAKRRRDSLSGSPSTSQGSIVTAISSGATDTFDGRSNTAYKRWLQAIQPTAAKHEYASFFDKKVAAEEVEFSSNLKAKLELLEEAEKIDPTADLAKAKSALQGIQARWEKAGKVPRDSIRKIEDRLKAVETKIKNVEAELWRKSDPATVDRTNSVRSQLEASIAKLEADLEKAKTSGDAKKIADATDALETKKAWLSVVIANS
jgi:ElaB/YqjD/DUF883 family membrane-anchored ribosome-binding protein